MVEVRGNIRYVEVLMDHGKYAVGGRMRWWRRTRSYAAVQNTITLERQLTDILAAKVPPEDA